MPTLIDKIKDGMKKRPARQHGGGKGLPDEDVEVAAENPRLPRAAFESRVGAGDANDENWPSFQDLFFYHSFCFL
jgi:hypothetical protein